MRPVFYLFMILLLAAAWPSMAQAGSQEDPEITDEDSDRRLGGSIPIGELDGTPGALSSSTELLAGWIQDETEESLTFVVHTQGGPATTNNVQGVVTLYDHIYDFHFVIAEVEYVASMRVDQVDGISFGGVASSAEIDQDAHLAIMTVPRDMIGDPKAGDVVTNVWIQATSEVANDGSPLKFTDRAPNDGFGRDYVLAAGPAADTGGGGGAANTDTDADGLNDTWEEEHFGNLTANATDDPDADGCDNACEFAAGTDPNLADTDGDGVSDGDEIAAGTDPLDPADGVPTGGNATAGDGGNATADPGTDGNATASPDDAGLDDTGDEADKKDKESPGFGLVAVVAALGVALVAARRRT